MRSLIPALCIVWGACAWSYAESRSFIDITHRTVYEEFSNLAFNYSSAPVNFGRAWSQTSLGFRVIVDRAEFVAAFASLGAWGAGGGYVSPGVAPSTRTMFRWENEYPYPDTRFAPWFAELYTRYTLRWEDVPRLGVVNAAVTVGRQRLQFLDGFVLGDNGIGLDGASITFDLDRYFYFKAFGAKPATDIYHQNRTLMGALIGSNYTGEDDFGLDVVVDNNSFTADRRTYMEFYSRKLMRTFHYMLQYAIHQGSRGDELQYKGQMFCFRAGMRGESSLLGKANLDFTWLWTSGGDNIEDRFEPTFARKYDGLNLWGIGEFSAISPAGSFFEYPAGYSGPWVFGFTLTVSPIARLIAGLNYYIYDFTYGPETPTAPRPSQVGQLLYARKGHASEYGFFARFEVAHQVSVFGSWSFFDPLANLYSPTGDPASKISVGTEARF